MLSKTSGTLILVKIISRREVLEEIVQNRLEPFNNYRTTANGKEKDGSYTNNDSRYEEHYWMCSACKGLG